MRLRTGRLARQGLDDGVQDDGVQAKFRLATSHQNCGTACSWRMAQRSAPGVMSTT